MLPRASLPKKTSGFIDFWNEYGSKKVLSNYEYLLDF